MKKLNELAKEIHAGNVKRGFFETEKNVGEMLMLTVSELSEALEADRKSKYTGEVTPLSVVELEEDHIFKDAFEHYIKDTFEDELADTLIRVLDMAAFRGIDIQSHVEAKMRYNSLRPYKHGKKY